MEHVAAAQTNKLASTMESIVERAVQAVAQAGLHRVLQDYMAWFTLGISVSSSQLQWCCTNTLCTSMAVSLPVHLPLLWPDLMSFLLCLLFLCLLFICLLPLCPAAWPDGSTWLLLFADCVRFQAADSSLEVQLSRVASLHYAVQLLDTALAVSPTAAPYLLLTNAAPKVHTPWERLQSLLLAALQYLQRNDIHSTQGTTQIVLPLPAFVRRSTKHKAPNAAERCAAWQFFESAQWFGRAVC